MSTINGTAGDDTLAGTSSGDVINGNGGDDVITAAGSSTVIHGNVGNDTITGGGSSNVLYGDSGSDVITGGGSSNSLYGDQGDDLLTAGGDSNTLSGGDGDDTLDSGGYDNTSLYGADGDDTYRLVWDDASTSDNYYAYIYDSSTSDDTLDLTGIVDDASQLSFSGSWSSLYIYVDNEDGDRIGSVTIANQFSSGAYRIETLIIGDETYDISSVTSAGALTSLIVYGATSGDDSIVGGEDQDTINGLGGDDTIYASTATYSRVYGDEGDDMLVATGSYQYIYGGSGDDTLTSGDGVSGYFYGGSGDDTYVVNWEDASSDSVHYAYIYDYNGTSSSGDDILDLSDVADSLDNIRFGGTYNDLYVYVYDDDENLIGRVTIDDHFYSYYDEKVETLVVGDDTVDLTDADNGVELNSIVVHGATNDADDITVTANSDIVYGMDGDDTLTAEGSGSYLYGQDGDDILIADTDTVYMYGGADDDTLRSGDNDNVYAYGGTDDDLYVVEWENAACDDTYSFEIGYNYGADGDDTLDLSAVADLEDVTFGGDFNSLYIYINDDDGNQIGTVSLPYQFYSYYADTIETVILGDITLDISGIISAGQLTSIVTYGASNGDDSIVGTTDSESIYGFDGDDTLISGGDSVILAGYCGDDLLEAGGSNNYLYGGNDDDTLDTGDNTGAGLYGYSDDDTYVISWENATSSNQYTAWINDYNGTSDSGDDTLDLSAVADSLDNVSFYGTSDLGIRIYDEDGNQIGTVTIDDQFYTYYDEQIETLILGDDTIDLTAYSSGNELNSAVIYGASDDDDAISSTAANESVYGLDGDDTISVTGNQSYAYGGDGDDVLQADSYDGGAYGGNGDDSISGSEYSAYLSGGTGDDTLHASGTYSSLHGSTGNDVLEVEGNYNYLYGGDGDDTYVISWANASSSNTHTTWIYDYDYTSDSGDDVLDLTNIASDLSNISFGQSYYGYDLYIYVNDDDGNRIGTVTIDDHFYYYYYDEKIETLRIGNQTFDLSSSSYSTIVAALADEVSNDADSRTGTTADDILYGYGGADTISGGSGADYLSGGKGDDVLSGNVGNDTLLGGNGADVLSGGGANDQLYGGNQSDLMQGEGGNDVLFGDVGNDTLDGGAGNDTASYINSAAGVTVDLASGGTSGQAKGDTYIDIEHVTGSRRSDSITGDDSDNRLKGMDGWDTLNGAGGDDVIEAGGGNDVVDGGEGDDFITGGSKNDDLSGGAGADTIDGGAGFDTISGGAGDDVLSGGAHADTFVFEDGSGDDTISDFSVEIDTLDLSDTYTDFTDLDGVESAATDTDEGLLIDLGNGDSVLIAGVEVSDLASMQIDL